MGGAAAAATRAFLDLDIGGHRAAHALACEFVAARSLMYGLSSPVLAELGGSERARLRELIAGDHDFGQRGRVELAPAPAERLVFELDVASAPAACANFAVLCAGTAGRA